MTKKSSRFVGNSAETSSEVARKLPSPTALISLTAIGIVIFLVALPSLRSFALRENEADAIRVLRALGRLCEAEPDHPAQSISSLYAEHPELQHQFGDLDHLEQPGLLRSHGYLFDLLPSERGPVLRAWPWSFGRTGFAVFQCMPDGRILGHPNSAGSWSGADSARARLGIPESGWREMR